DGVITQRNYRNGHYLRGGDGAGQLPLLTLQRTDRVRLVAHVAEQDVPLTETGLPVDLTIPALPDPRFRGLTVSRLGFALDGQTRQMRVEVDVPNPRDHLRPGMYAGAAIELKRPAHALRVPDSSLVGNLDDKKGTVYVIRDGKAHRTRIRVG